MGSIRIAPELLLLILEYITSPMVLANLCLLDTQTRDMILPILYETCDINSLEGVSAFCKAIKEDVSLGLYVKELHMRCLPPPSPRWNGEDFNELMEMLGIHPFKEPKPGPEEPLCTDGILSELRVALGLLPNLGTMMLAYGRGLSNVFDGLEVSFKLKTLVTVHFPGEGFIQFLENQKSIGTLRIQTLDHSRGGSYDPDSNSDDEYFRPRSRRRRVPDTIIKKAADPSFLPNLKLLATEPLKCIALAPGRPITYITVTQNGDAPWLSHNRYQKLAQALGKTSVPLQWLDFTSRWFKPREVDSWEFLDFICETGVPETLRMLVLHDTEGNLINHSTQYHFLWSKAQLLGEKFKVLERFEVPIRDDTMGVTPKRPLSEGLGDMLFGAMGGLSTWQMACPTLKKVILYDNELV